LAILGRTKQALKWYGATEVKWFMTTSPRNGTVEPSKGRAWDDEREKIVQDAVRLTYCQTQGPNAHFLVLGISRGAERALFDAAHKKDALEERRIAFSELFPRVVGEKKNSNKLQHTLTEKFNEALNRVPDKILEKQPFRGLTTSLMAKAKVHENAESVKAVIYVWQCNLIRGRKSNAKKRGKKNGALAPAGPAKQLKVKKGQ
jgi:hypothetical protein